MKGKISERERKKGEEIKGWSKREGREKRAREKETGRKVGERENESSICWLTPLTG